MRNVTYINAGAGSGKTYTLTKILADKLSAGEVTPSKVILTTFTELAAAEFREKARQQILSTGNMDCASQMDCAAIGTVHSVALRFIKKFWYLLEYGADIQTISERDENFYMSQSLARITNMPDHKPDLDNFRKFRDNFDILDSSNHPDHLFWQQHLNAVVEKMEYYGVDDVEESIRQRNSSPVPVFPVYSTYAPTKLPYVSPTGPAVFSEVAVYAGKNSSRYTVIPVLYRSLRIPA